MSSSRTPRLDGANASAHCDDRAPDEPCDSLRCACGALLARYVGGHVELKCRRCKRTMLVPIEADT